MKPSPWYKQFWPWFVIAIPMSSVFVAVIQISLALQSPNDLVKENYYKEGLGINKVLDKRQKAKELSVAAEVLIDNLTGEIILTTQNTQASILELSFVHSAIANKDFSLTLNRIAENEYRGQLNKTLQGIWSLYLDSEQGWQVSARLDMAKVNSARFSF
ncbi:hypothetical protein CBF23_011870 [Marinomonas agarivorans]|nr:hypothetical protein CBF23_011870 [Marinomonas agarivorans]